MAISEISSVAQADGTATITLGTHAAGDLILITAWNQADGTTPPSLPAGWTSIQTKTASTFDAMRQGYKIAASSSETSGTWTNAGNMVATVYRGIAASPIGAKATATGTSTTVTYASALTLNVTDGSSWVAAAVGDIVAPLTALTPPPAGLTARATANDGSLVINLGVDSNAGVSSWTAKTKVIANTAEWVSGTVELLAAASASNTTDFFQFLAGA